MIFRPESAQRIIDGSKTVTRRVATSPCQYRVGQDYSVQPGRGKHEVARILVTSIIREPLRKALAASELAREGFGPEHTANHQAAMQIFREVWADLHGGFDPELVVDRIEFELVSA